MLMWPNNDGLLSAVAVVDQIGLTSDEKGNGAIWTTIQSMGTIIASEMRFIGCMAVAISLSGPVAADTSMRVTTSATA
jgi:hypothetical protein